MKRPSITSLVIFAALTLSAAAALPAQATAAADSAYAAMLRRASSGDSTIDFAAFRDAYAHSAGYDPMSAERTALHQRLNRSLAAEDIRAATARADSLLAINYTDINAHVIAASLLAQAHDSIAARQHASIARGFMRSLDLAHRGSSVDTPIVIILPDDENVFGLATGLERTAKYTTAECGSRVCDSVVYHNPRTGRDTTIVFDITVIARRSLRQNP